MAVLVGLTTVGAPVAQANHVQNFLIPLNNWQVGGSLGVKKLNDDIQLPPGAVFNGGITPQLTVAGHTTIPDFTTTVNLLGLLPNHISLSITEAAPTTGTVRANPDGTTTTKVTVSSDIRIKSLRAGVLPVPVGRNCHTSSPVVLNLEDTGPIDLLNGFAFDGTYTIPKLTGCGLVTPTLNLLMAGPNNPYSLTLKPPGAG
ncbi:MAG: hypothetical protein ACRDKV_08155 [Solirubrobacterales bacterium]